MYIYRLVLLLVVGIYLFSPAIPAEQFELLLERCEMAEM